MNIAFQSALHDHSAGSDVGFNTSVRTDCQPVSLRVDRAFHLAIYIKVFVAQDFPFDRNGLADEGHFRGCMRWLRRIHELSLPRKLLWQFCFYWNRESSPLVAEYNALSSARLQTILY